MLVIGLLYNELVTRILIINLHSSLNAGDAALTFTTSHQLHEAFPGSTVTLSMNDPLSHPQGDPRIGSFMYWFHSLSHSKKTKWRFSEILRLGAGSLLAVISFRRLKRPLYLFLNSSQKEFLQAYFSADLVVSAPGNFLYSSGKVGLSFLTAIYSMTFAIWAKKPLYLLPQSIGPLRRNWEHWLVRRVLDRARLILVREEASIEELKRIHVTNPNVSLLPDMAFTLSAAPAREAISWVQSASFQASQGKPLLGVTAINWGEQTGQKAIQAQYELALAKAISSFIDKTQGNVLFFTQVAGSTASADDRLPARRIIALLPALSDHIKLIDSPTSPAILKAAYGLMDIFIGTRMHSNIFAISSGVPVLAIAYRHKTQGIMHMLGLDAWSIDIHDVKDNTLADLLENLWEHRKDVRAQIEQNLPGILAQSNRAGEMIAKDFAAYKGGNP